LPASEPERGPRALDGHSAVFEGEACRDEECFSFEADIDLTPREAGDVTLPGLDTAFAVIEGEQELKLRIDTNAWLAGVDFEELMALANDEGITTITVGSQAYESIALAMTNRSVPAITWTDL